MRMGTHPLTSFGRRNGYSCPMRLDKIAEDLPYTMEFENLSSVPVEPRNALPADFPAETSTTTFTSPQAIQETDHDRGRSSGLGLLPDGAHEGALASNVLQHLPRPTAESMAQAAGLLSEPLARPSRGSRQQSEFSSAVTLVNSEKSFSSPESSQKPEGGVLDQKLKSENQRDETGVENALQLVLLFQWLSRIGIIIALMLAEGFGVPFWTKSMVEGRTPVAAIKETGRSSTRQKTAPMKKARV